MSRAFLVALLAAASALPAQAWDPAGHMLVGQVAWNQASPEIRRQVGEAVALLPNQYNLGRAYHFVTVNCWMDDMRSLPGYAQSKWHYMNVPWTPDAAGFALAEGPNVVTELERNAARLRAGGLSPLEKAVALATVIHLVGDLHQPLHTCDRHGDRGGNGYLIYGVPFTDLWPGTVPNLHTLWDKGFHFDEVGGAIAQTWIAPLLEERPATPGEGIIAREAAALVQKWPVGDFAPAELAGTSLDWARESYTLACRQGYPLGEPPGETAAQTMEPAFIHQVHEVATRRIVQAGTRLARLLEEVLVSPTPAAVP